MLYVLCSCKIKHGTHKTEQCACSVAGTHHGVCIDVMGAVYTWGDYTAGALGVHYSDESSTNTPVAVEALHEWHVVQVAAGGRHTIALGDDGTVHQWGTVLNEPQAGYDPVLHWSGPQRWVVQAIPSRVEDLHGKPVVEVAAGVPNPDRERDRHPNP